MEYTGHHRYTTANPLSLKSKSSAARRSDCMQPNSKSAIFAVHLTRFGLRSLTLLFGALLIISSPLVAKAQGPSSFWIAPYQPDTAAPATNSVEAATVAIPTKFVVDTDPGVDDATA